MKPHEEPYRHDSDFADMYNTQRELQVQFMGGDPAGLVGEERRAFVSTMALALITEVAELLQETTWKTWTKGEHFEREAYCEELIDVLHFWFNLGLVGGFTADELMAAYHRKVEVNRQRQRDGYTGRDKGGVAGGSL